MDRRVASNRRWTLQSLSSARAPDGTVSEALLLGSLAAAIKGAQSTPIVNERAVLYIAFAQSGGVSQDSLDAVWKLVDCMLPTMGCGGHELVRGEAGNLGEMGIREIPCPHIA